MGVSAQLNGGRSPQELAYQRASEIADILLSWGLPVIGFSDMDCGTKVGIAFQLDGTKYGARLPVEDATPEKFREFYEAVA